jgi:hypothetical protein
MIVKNERDQSLQCDLCGELTEMCRRTMNNPELKLILMERLRVEHEPCEEFAGDPDRARIERVYKLRMAVELRKLKRK